MRVLGHSTTYREKGMSLSLLVTCYKSLLNLHVADCMNYTIISLCIYSLNLKICQQMPNQSKSTLIQTEVWSHITSEGWLHWWWSLTQILSNYLEHEFFNFIFIANGICQALPSMRSSCGSGVHILIRNHWISPKMILSHNILSYQVVSSMSRVTQLAENRREERNACWGLTFCPEFRQTWTPEAAFGAG